MRPVDNKKQYIYESAHENNHIATSCNFKCPKGSGTDKASHHGKAMVSRSKPTPSKWDDAQKWLVGLSGGGDHSRAKNKPCSSNAADWRLLGLMTQISRHSCSSMDEGETKKIAKEFSKSCRINKPAEDSLVTVRPVSVRDMGTEMTPVASKEPSRTTTPLRPRTPVGGSPISSRASTPGRCRQGGQPPKRYQTSMNNMERRCEAVHLGMESGNLRSTANDLYGCRIHGNNESEQIRDPSSLESQAMAWDEAEHMKYTARCKREEVEIQAWETHETRKAKMEMRRMEMKAEILKSRAQERLVNKLAATRRIADEKRANAEARLHEQAAKTLERADYIKRTGHLPFSFKLPSLCS